jgi:hypothetical protein
VKISEGSAGARPNQKKAGPIGPAFTLNYLLDLTFILSAAILFSGLLFVSSDVDIRTLHAGVPGKVERTLNRRAQIDARIYRRRS